MEDMSLSNLCVYSEKLRHGEFLKGENEEDFLRYFETIIPGHKE